MYLSRVQIDNNNRQKIQDLTQLGAYHGWVEDTFPHESRGYNQTRKLWRIDTVNGRDYLMLVSRHEPDVSILERYGVPGSSQTLDYDQVLNHLQDGMKLKFRAVLHPTVSKYQGKGKRGKRVQCLNYHDQVAYLADRAQKNGFSLDTLPTGDYSCFITDRDVGIMKKRGHKPVRIRKVSYEGYLTITDVASFREMLCNGLGRKKAYGCGMMTIARI